MENKSNWVEEVVGKIYWRLISATETLLQFALLQYLVEQTAVVVSYILKAEFPESNYYYLTVLSTKPF